MRLIVANLYVGNRRIREDVRLIDRHHPNAVFVAEAARHHDELTALHGELHIGSGSKARRNTGVLTTGIEVSESWIEFLSADTGFPSGKERWAMVVRCQVDGVPTALIGLHLTAGLARDVNMRAHRGSMNRLRKIAKAEQAAGFTPVLAGDFNDRGRVRPHYTPQELARDLGLAYHWHRNDGVMYDPEVFALRRPTVLHPVGSNHDWPMVDLTVRRPADPEPAEPKEKEAGMKFVSRTAWGARSGATRHTHPIGSTRGVTFHWEGPKMGGFAHDRCPRLVRSIQRFHQITRGWADIAYNAVVCPHGYVFEGRGLWTTPAANGWAEVNDDWYAVCYLGGQGDGFTDAGKDGFIAARNWLVAKGGAGPRVNGHRDHKPTACPGDAIYRWLHNTDWTTATEEDDVSAEDVWDYDIPERDKDTDPKQHRAKVMLGLTHKYARDARRAARRAEAAVAALAKALGPEVEAAVEQALAEAVVEVDVEVVSPDEET